MLSRKKNRAAAAAFALCFRTENICCPKRLIGRPQEALLCAKAKRQRRSAQSERKSTTRYDDEPYLVCFYRQPIDRLNKKKIA